MLLVKKCNFYFYMFLVKKKLQIRFKDVLDKKQPFFDYKNKIFDSLKNRIFQRD